MSDKNHLPLLKEGNYVEWRARVKAYLVGADLWEVVGPEKDEVVAKGVKGVAAKKKKNELAYSKILETLSSSQMAYVLGTENPREAWGLLEEVHRSSSVNSILALRRRFFRMMKDESESIITWIARVRTAALELKYTDHPVSELDIIMVVTDGLDSEIFGDVVSALDALPAKDIKMSDVTTRLLGKEAMLNRRGEKLDDLEIRANYASDRRGGKGTGSVSRHGPELTCFNCGGRGHYADDCPSPPPPPHSVKSVGRTYGQGSSHRARIASEVDRSDGQDGTGERAAFAQTYGDWGKMDTLRLF